jgi:hypothetical protein
MQSFVEGTFGKAFKRHVHPIEIAKALTRQMDEGRMISISRTYAPNDFTIHLSEEDLEGMQAYQESLREEIIQYASAHGEEKQYHLVGPVQVEFTSEEALKFGEFGITAKLTGSGEQRERGAPSDTSGNTRIFRSEGTTSDQPGTTEALSREEARGRGLAWEVVELVVNGAAHPLEGNGPWGVGRSSERDIVVEDPNVSRMHARISREDSGFVIEDAGSTNGTFLNGAPIERERIEDDDELTFGQVGARFVRRQSGEG